MIVLYKDNGWQITTQRAHGMLAAQIAMHWKNIGLPERWLETLLAIAEHDDAENELDGEDLITDSGGPLNYTMKHFDLAHCEKLVRHSAIRSQYISLLTSLHMEFLYGKDAKHNKIAEQFLREQKKFRTAVCKKLSVPITELKKIYSFLEWCDAFSLIVCSDQAPPENRKLEISSGPDKICYELFRLKEDVLVVDPWPFETDHFSVHFETRLIDKMHFNSSAEFRKVFLTVSVQEICWKIIKKPVGYRRSKKV